jgi:divinyl protochlorophyllide a 8-vinyl-reductase
MHAAASQARIGPNAITRVAQALPPRVGNERTRALFARAGLSAYLQTPPEDMVDEAEVLRLHMVLRSDLGEALAAQVASTAGTLTADYLLQRRIPKPVQALLKIMPAPLAARVLLMAITRNAWTFVGSGRFEVRRAPQLQILIHDNPLCRGVKTETPACDFYAAVFSRLFAVLVHPRAEVVETACEAQGDKACIFEPRW